MFSRHRPSRQTKVNAKKKTKKKKENFLVGGDWPPYIPTPSLFVKIHTTRSIDNHRLLTDQGVFGPKSIRGA